MAITIKPALSKKDLTVFASLPYEMYKGDPYWVPPLRKDELKSLQPEHNPAFTFCEAAFWLAYRDHQCVGRIGAIINRTYNEKTGEKMGRISRFEAIDDKEVAARLFETAESWIREKGMIGVHGPLGFSNLDTQGLLIEGFDHLPSIASVHNKPYYHKFFDERGYVKENDWLEFRLKIQAIPEKAARLNEMMKERSHLKTISFRSGKAMMHYGVRIFSLLNQAFAELPYVSPFGDDLIKYYSEKYFKMLNPKFVKVIEGENGRIVGFIVGLPSMSEAMQKANGKLFPFGFIHILKALKHPKVVDLLLTGVDPQMQGRGATAMLIFELQKVMLEHGVTDVETTGMFESNQKAIQHWKSYDHIQHKRRRCYRKMF
jgi:hypothetical protein